MNITTQKKAWSIITEKRFYTNIMILAIPIILQQFLRVSVDTADSIMLGSIDQIHMTAVSQAQQIFLYFIHYVMDFLLVVLYSLLNIGNKQRRD